MTDPTLVALAEAAGVAPRWQDVHGQSHAVSEATLRAVLHAIGLPAATPRDIAGSLAELRRSAETLPPLLTAEAGMPLPMPGPWRTADAEGHDTLRLAELGYHRVETDRGIVTVAVAPRRCHPVPDGRPWGIAVQLYGLRRDGDGGIGDFAALADFARAAAARGVDAVAISPVHALFSADPARFSPYSPSSRIMLNAMHAEPPRGHAGLEAEPLIDWPQASRHRLDQFRTLFDTGADAGALAAFRAERGDSLEAHARFEALQAHLLARDPSLWHWRDWPETLRAPSGPAVGEFARGHAQDVAFHAWLQWRADCGLARAQAAARDHGMRIGLITDLAVGTDGSGSHAWSRQDETLLGLSVGAPPDLLNTKGQDWGLAAFSPRGLRQHGYAAFIEMLRAALRHAGGLRIDHAMGLQRLWVVPEGAAASDGAYLSYPVQDLLRLITLESARHRAVVLAEDLGTVPEGFADRLSEAGVLGMRVLWFERDGEAFRAPGDWTRDAVAMTSTHDLPTVSGWWRGRDIDWRARIGLVPDVAAAREERTRDRAALWQAFRDSGAAGDGCPPDRDGVSAADAACAHVARAASSLAILQVEDVLALEDQPNLPGARDEHPNWRRRLDGPAASLLDPPAVSARLAAIAAARTREPEPR